MESEVRMPSTPAEKIFTIGHSNHPIENFLSLLEKHEIDVVVDARSSPFSKFSPQFNQQNLKLSIRVAGRKYLFLGLELGGMPRDSSFYDNEGYVLYWKIAESELFQQGIQRLRTGIAAYTVALLCGEEDPLHCHRRLLIGRVLRQLGVELIHIRGNGLVQTEAELESRASSKQLVIFSSANEEQRLWRSIQSVSPKKPQLGSFLP